MAATLTVAVTEVAPDALPMNAEPAKSVAAAVAGHDAILEPKLDGWRLICIRDEDSVRLFSRQGKEYSGSLPAIEAELLRALPAGSVLDAEAVAFEVDSAGTITHKWGTIQSVLGSGTAKAALRSAKVTLVVFDLIAHGGIDARPATFGQRREVLERLFEQAKFAPCVTLVPQLPATDDTHDALLAAGYEGSMVKWLDAPYRSGVRGKGQFKIKAQTTVDVVVMGYKPGTPGSSFDGKIGAIEFGQHDANGKLIHRGRCSGMDWATRCAISADPDAFLGTVFEVAHMGIMPPGDEYPLGALRHPQFKRFRPDRSAASVEVHDA